MFGFITMNIYGAKMEEFVPEYRFCVIRQKN